LLIFVNTVIFIIRVINAGVGGGVVHMMHKRNEYKGF